MDENPNQIIEEVVCGFGRTGPFCGHDQYDMQLDRFTMARGLADSFLIGSYKTIE